MWSLEQALPPPLARGAPGSTGQTLPPPVHSLCVHVCAGAGRGVPSSPFVSLNLKQLQSFARVLELVGVGT